MVDEAQNLPPLIPGAFIVDGDPADWRWLPESVRDKLKALRRDRDAAGAALVPLRAEIDTLRQERAWSESRLRALNSDGRARSPDDPFAVREREKIDAATKELVKLEPIEAERAARFHEKNRLVDNVEKFLANTGGGAFELDDGGSPELKKGETILAAIERHRRRVRELLADRHAVESAPWPSADAKARARREIEHLAERGRPSVGAMIESNDEGVGWQREVTDLVIAGRLTAHYGDPNPTVLFWLFKDEITAKIEKEIDAVGDDAAALTAAQRREKIAVIERDRLAVERDEEKLIEVALAQGHAVARRSDADPRAVLGLVDVADVDRDAA